MSRYLEIDFKVPQTSWEDGKGPGVTCVNLEGPRFPFQGS